MVNGGGWVVCLVTFVLNVQHYQVCLCLPLCLDGEPWRGWRRWRGVLARDASIYVGVSGTCTPLLGHEQTENEGEK